ncbi:MAG TPA: LysM peptidoglycan-binding domain-containing protein [Opitutaceae bacterium]
MIPQVRFLTVVVAVHMFCLSSLAQLAPSLLERAATGDATAMHLIGRAAVSGGKPVEAYAWFSLAAEYGVETTEKSALFNALSPEQVTEATRRIEGIRSTQLRGLPSPAKKPVARVVETKPATTVAVAMNPVEGKPVAPPPATPAIAQPAIDGQVEAHKAQIARLETDLAGARAEVSDARKQSEERTTQLDAALAKAGQERDALASELSTLRRDKQRAEESLAQMQAKPSLDGQIEALKAQIAKLETDLTDAHSEVRAAKARSQEESARLEAALAQASRERDALSGEIAALKKDKQHAEESLAQMRAQPSLEGQVQAQKAQIAKLETDFAAAHSETSAANAKADEKTTQLEVALAKAGQERETLSAEIATLRRDKQRAEESLAQMQAKPSLEGKVQEQTAQIARLKTDLAAARSEASAAKEKVGDTTKLDAALAQATQERDALAAEIATLRRDKQRAEESLAQIQAKPSVDGQVEAQKAQITKLEADLAAARSETSAAKERVAELNTQLQVALAKPSQEKSALPAEIATLRQDRLRAEQARDQLRVDFAAARSKLEADLAASQTETRAAKAQIAKLEADLAAARSEARSGKAQFAESTSSLRAAPLRTPVAEAVDTPASALPRVHTVASGENLSSISQRYYGTPNRWDEIFDANRDVLNSPNQLALGTRLRIP